MGLWWTKIFCSNFGHLAANPASTCTQKFYREEGLFTRFVKLITTAGVWACGEKMFWFFYFPPPTIWLLYQFNSVHWQYFQNVSIGIAIWVYWWPFFKYYIILLVYKAMEEFWNPNTVYSAESLVVQTSGHRGGKQEETQKLRPRSHWPLMTRDVICSVLCKDFANLQWIPINKARMHVVLLSQC